MSTIVVRRRRAEVAQQVEHLRLDRHVERRGRFVGQQERGLVREGGRDHDALAHAAGQPMGRVAVAPFGLGDPDLLEQRERARPRRLRVDVAVGGDRLRDLVADRERRIERGHRVLEDHADPVAAEPAELLGFESDEVVALEPHRTTDGGARGQEAHRGHRERRLAAPRLADEAEDLALRDGQRHVADGRDRPVVGGEADRRRARVAGRFRSSCDPFGIEPCPEAVAEEVEREHRDRDREAGEDLDPRRLRQHVAAVGEHRAE